MPPLVLDTNVVLDLFVFDDPRTRALRAAVEAGALWLATARMREELARVLEYPLVAKRREFHRLGAADVLVRFDRHASPADEPPPAPYRCKDPDDQMFVDLAVAHRAQLVSKDREVLKMKNRLLRLGCPPVAAAWAP